MTDSKGNNEFCGARESSPHFKFQLTEIPILATLCAPWKKKLPLWPTSVGYVGAFFIPHACLQLGG